MSVKTMLMTTAVFAGTAFAVPASAMPFRVDEGASRWNYTAMVQRESCVTRTDADGHGGSSCIPVWVWESVSGSTSVAGRFDVELEAGWIRLRNLDVHAVGDGPLGEFSFPAGDFLIADGAFPAPQPWPPEGTFCACIIWVDFSAPSLQGTFDGEVLTLSYTKPSLLMNGWELQLTARADGFQPAATPVPAPGPLALLLSGLMMLARRRRR